MRYIVEGPDGKRYIVEGPDTPAAPPAAPEKPISPVAGDGSEGITAMDFATPLGIGAAMKLVNPRTRAAALADIENARAGAGQALVKAGRGVKKLFDPINIQLERALGGPEASRVLGQRPAEESARETAQNVAEAKRLDAPLEATGAGKFGNFVGNIALTAVPGAGLQKALAARLGAGRLATALAAGGSGAGTEFVTAEGDLGDKAKAAGVAGAAGFGLTGALAAAAKPFQASRDAIDLYRQGINPTLQQAAEGAPGRFVGGLAAGGQGVKDRQRLELARAALSRVGATPADDMTGRGIAGAAQKAVGAEYDALLGPKQFDLTPQSLGNAIRAANSTNAQGQMAKEATTAGRAAANIIGPGNLNTGLRQVPDKVLYKNYLTPLNEAAQETTNMEVKRRLLDARRAILDVRDAQLSPEELKTLRNIDVRNFDVKRLQEATAGEAGDKLGVSLRSLSKAYGGTNMAGNTTREELIGPMVRTIGKADNANAARSTAQTAMRIGAPLTIGGGAALLGAPMVAAPLAAAYGLSAIGQTAKGAKVLTGQTAKQKALMELLRSGYGASVAPTLTNLEGSYVP